MRELRRAPRVPVSHMVVNLPQGYRLVRGNVSLFGVGFELSVPCHLKPGDPLEIRLFLPEETLLVRATVTRIRRPEPQALGRMYVGAEINGLDELVANPLFRFVEETALLRRPIQPTSSVQP
jgi:hypothetical protein